MRLILFFSLFVSLQASARRGVSLAPMRFADYQMLTNADNPLTSSKNLARQFDFTLSNTGIVAQTVTITVTMGNDFFADATHPSTTSPNALTPYVANFMGGTETTIPAGGGTTTYTGSLPAGSTQSWKFQFRFKGKNFNSAMPATYSYGGSVGGKIEIAEDAGSITASIQSHSEWNNLSNPPDFGIPLAMMRNVSRDYSVLGGHAF